MLIEGKYAKAKVYAEIIDQGAIEQITQMLNQPFAEGSKVAIMPDVHAGAGCTIGTTMTINDKIVPNLVGVDIGCGVVMAELKDTEDLKEADLKRLDEVIKENIPSGFDVRDKHWRKDHQGSNAGSDFWGLTDFREEDLRSLCCVKEMPIDRAIASIGSLGGGNHYIELDKGSDGKMWLSVHSGSRNLGTCAAEYYQKLAIQERRCFGVDAMAEIKNLREKYKDTPEVIGERIRELRATKREVTPDALCWLDGSGLDDYLHDMGIIQRYAVLNRKAMVHLIAEKMGFKIRQVIETIHNYIDLENMILRKGAVSAQKDEVLVIPINMRDGILICKGRGNPDWNCSAPHGAGRIMSRKAAKDKFQLEEFKKSMAGIYTTTVGTDTIDEAPMAYKPIEVIKDNIKETVEIMDTVVPIYNFKAADKPKRKREKNLENPEADKQPINNDWMFER